MCINTKYSMSIIEKVFHYEENEITVIKCRDEIWFRTLQKHWVMRKLAMQF